MSMFRPAADVTQVVRLAPMPLPVSPARPTSTKP